MGTSLHVCLTTIVLLSTPSCAPKRREWETTFRKSNQPELRLISAYFNAIKGHDPNTLSSLLSNDFTYYSGDTAWGKAEHIKFLFNWFIHDPNRYFLINSVEIHSDHIAVYGILHQTIYGETEQIKLFYSFDFENGRITKIFTGFDRE